MRAVFPVQHTLYSLNSMIMSGLLHDQGCRHCALSWSCLCFLQTLNGIMHYRPNWAILCFQTPPRSTVCILEQTQRMNAFNRQAVSLPLIRSACPVLNRVAYKYRTYCLIWTWSGTHIHSCEDAVGRMSHCTIPNRSLPKNKTLGTTKTALIFLWTQRFWPLASATA